MGRFLFTTILLNDLGVPTRSMPIALELKKRGHEVAFCNPMPAPTRFIEEAGVSNLPIEMGAPPPPSEIAPIGVNAWNLDHMLCMFGHLDEAFVENCVRAFVDVIDAFEADVVVDSFVPTACIAARACGKPLATIIQADLHPTNIGFMWWKDQPENIPSPAAALNAVLSNHGLDSVSSSSDLVIGDLTLCAGTPETDPVPHASDVVHTGPMFSSQAQAPLPDWIDDFAGDKPLIWVYCGNPRYKMGPNIAGPGDSIVVLRAAFEVLADLDARVIVTAGFQERPEELPPPPDNFREADFLPGLSLARRCDLVVHHGGHGSCMTGAFAGTPALIIPTISERESNARRMTSLGVAELLIPTVDESGEMRISSVEFGKTVQTMLADSSYRTKAAALSKRMGEYGGPGAIADRIEALL